ncbi:argininosuccinate synthase [Aspergillus terreus NIH2624]|uniref:Argininosuccinate synthase n=1 Tax=Aspergillus terreus (strain NIH 2624 / FGSC A1156) TaxID=341663 RepID=Q0CQ23_ASPTN|nr:argininosuccinate synthase [Aspergillus terreus NIH2624]EAU36013.1 argininosuccinate synthase [Aspergillus terreus NIH2624]
MADKPRVCLAYSEEGYDVVCFLANVGQEEDWAAVEAKALKIGAKKMIIEDLRREFITELCFPAIRTSLARPVIARAQMRAAQREGCQFVSHGATGKGNDQVRFELAFYAIQPSIKIIAPWRDPKFFQRFAGRNDLLDYAAQTGIPVTSTKAKPWSMDSNSAHCSYEAGVLEDPNHTPPADMWTMTQDPMNAPNEPTDITIHFEQGIPVKVVTPDATYTDPVELFNALNKLGNIHGVGRIDIVENRFIGLKSRGCYDCRLQDFRGISVFETDNRVAPAMTILRDAHLDLEGLVLDGQVRALRDQFVTHNWSIQLYNGYYFSAEREFIENSLKFSQRRVNGEVRLRLYKGHTYILGRSSSTEKLYSEQEASMDSLEDFEPTDTTGFIAISSIRLKKYGLQKAEEGESLSRA